MAITYPIALPTSPGFTRVTIQPRSAVALYASPFTMQQQVYAHQGQMWTGQVELPPMSRDEAAPWAAALTSLNGIQGTFILGDPAWLLPRGTATGTPLVKGGSQTGYDLVTDGWTAGIEALKAGDWVQLGAITAPRLYQVQRPANTGTNLLLRSEDFANASWTKTQTTITPAAIVGPFGTLTGSKQVSNNGQALSGTRIFQSITKAASSLAYTASIYVKYGGHNQILFYASDVSGLTNQVNARWRTDTGVLVSTASGGTGFTLTGTSSTAVGNGWYRFTMSFTTDTATSLFLSIYDFDTVITNGDGIAGIFIDGAQIEQAASAGPYNATTSAAKTVADETTLTLWPRLRSSPADNAPITVSNPVGIWRLTGNVPWSVSVDQLTHGLALDIVEAI
jgi:hypothetical protein